MNFNIGKLYFTASPLAFWIGVAALVIVAILCSVALFRAARKWRSGSLEVLRFLCTALIVLILWSPELREVKEPEDEPMIAILYDESFSMTTIDARVANLFGNTGGRKVLSRQEWVEFALDDSHWESLKEAGDGAKIIKTPFSTDNGQSTNRSGSDYYKALNDILDENDNVKAIIVLGDGDYNTGEEPLKVAQKAQRQRVPLYTIGVGKDSYLPDLEIVSLSAPKYGIVGEAIQIPFSIRSSISRDVKTTITLREKNSKKQEVKQITIPSNNVYNDSILFRLDKERNYDFELRVATQSSEIISENNEQTFQLSAQKENIKVLVIDTMPRWEYRFIRNALSRDPGVDLDCLLLHPSLGSGDGSDYIQTFPADLAELQKYDVVFLPTGSVTVTLLNGLGSIEGLISS